MRAVRRYVMWHVHNQIAMVLCDLAEWHMGRKARKGIAR